MIVRRARRGSRLISRAGGATSNSFALTCRLVWNCYLVVKDEAYGDGLLPAARLAGEAGVRFLAVSTVEEGVKLRAGGVRQRILVLGDRQEAELPWCVAHDLTCCVAEPGMIAKLARLAQQAGKRFAVHLKINTGMNRYGVRWNEVLNVAGKDCRGKISLAGGGVESLRAIRRTQ
ncbi:MAG: alanine racemase [Propionivibrio sp.]